MMEQGREGSKEGGEEPRRREGGMMVALGAAPDWSGNIPQQVPFHISLCGLRLRRVPQIESDGTVPTATHLFSYSFTQSLTHSMRCLPFFFLNVVMPASQPVDFCAPVVGSLAGLLADWPACRCPVPLSLSVVNI
eukprot:GHVU01004716.1.p1 GENE.GHVU01004716.1~~GHVU01004716.1.p1  ORF type:complete len:135 (-),score=5.83 GHVU01004716.1:73-477(-)